MTTEHPFQLFEELDAATEAALTASIRRWGVLQPIVVDQDYNVIDGHHRLRIGTALGVEVPRQVRAIVDANEGRELAASLNLDRRQVLDAEVRRQVVADLRQQGHSMRSIAGALGVSKSQIAKDVDQLSTSGQLEQPETVRGIDGRERPATRPAPPAVEPEAPVIEDHCEICGEYSGECECDNCVDCGRNAYTDCTCPDGLPAQQTQPDLDATGNVHGAHRKVTEARDALTPERIRSDVEIGIERNVSAIRKFLDGWVVFAHLRENKHRDRVIAAFSAPDRDRIHQIEEQVWN